MSQLIGHLIWVLRYSGRLGSDFIQFTSHNQTLSPVQPDTTSSAASYFRKMNRCLLMWVTAESSVLPADPEAATEICSPSLISPAHITGVTSNTIGESTDSGLGSVSSSRDLLVLLLQSGPLRGAVV